MSNALTETAGPGWGDRLRGVPLAAAAAPLLLMTMLAMVVLPLPPFVLDLLFTFNIAVSLMVVLGVVYVMRPLDFSVFPTILLLATLLRLALNVASTRVVLLNGHEGGDAAGKVIEAFGSFVVGGNYGVGIAVFLILTIVNFVVITKGAGRVSEVSARFMLDALPGRQMAIDADLNAGTLTREEASARREELREETDFYGAMDGASKFVRGDAIAGILILAVNLIGGFAIGMASHGLSAGEAGSRYTLLTIGDGLVAQIPALLLATAVAILVTRLSRSQAMGASVRGQLFGDPRALLVTGGLLTALGFVPGMPNVVFLLLGGVALGAAWLIQTRRAAEAVEQAAEDAAPETEAKRDLSWEDMAPADALALEIGYRLVPLADDKAGGELMGRIRGVRRRLSDELGFLVPQVHVRDNLSMEPAQYRILIGGAVVGHGEVMPERWLALDPGNVIARVEGHATKDPTFGMPALWIEAETRAQAQANGYTVVDPATVVATHISHIVQNHAHEVLGPDETQHLLDVLARSSPKMVEDLVPKTLPLATVTRVLQALLAEKVSLKNLRAIIGAMAERASAGTTDPQALLAAVRAAVGRQIVQTISGGTDDLPVLSLAPALERLLQDGAGNNALEPGLAERLQQAIGTHAERQEASGDPVVLLVPPALRPTLARFVRAAVPSAHVLAFDEIPDTTRLRLAGTVE
ncbi:flagellar biosynthesis protein FlhA [Algiphilus aromaticivorans]|uniref:flagellar biosynthesis protein FlhA n=1 Tax=Algiphilus aromaticivorans TaxID=382454 RepID=UPI000A022517|nr:flagellar biosynthesis protein FlhA [Algiphilus aromaticivorans]